MLRLLRGPHLNIHLFARDRDLIGLPEDAPADALAGVAYPWKDRSGASGAIADIEVYAEWTMDVQATRQLFETAIESGVDPPALTAIAEEISTEAFRCALELFGILRGPFDQYWLRAPTRILNWASVIYFSMGRGDSYECYSIVLPDEFWPAEEWPPSGVVDKTRILGRRLSERDLQAIGMAEGVGFTLSFPDDMISTALIELTDGRVRSAILHGFMAFEVAVKRQVGEYLGVIVGEPAHVPLIEVIARELSVPATARLLELHAHSEDRLEDVDWQKLDALHNTRNTIVHLGQRRLPRVDVVLPQLFEVYRYVRHAEARMRQRVRAQGQQ